MLGNAQANGNPIVYCSDGFVDLTGYSRAQIMQKGKAIERKDIQTDVRKDRRKAQHFNTHLNVFVHFIQLFANNNNDNDDNIANRLLMSFPLRAGYKGRAQTAN